MLACNLETYVALGTGNAMEPPFAEAPSPWTAKEENLLALGRRIFGSDCCKLARLVGTRSCRDVARLMEVPYADEYCEDNSTKRRKGIAVQVAVFSCSFKQDSGSRFKS